MSERRGRKHYISRRVLRTELKAAADCIEKMDYGYARKLVLRCLERVDEYDLPGGKKGEGE